MEVERNRVWFEQHGLNPADMRWECGYDDPSTLEVAVHMRRGDLYGEMRTLTTPVLWTKMVRVVW